MDIAGFIVASYLITIGGISLFALLTLLRAKKSARLVRDRDKTWL